jgi:hypothetical protein
MAEINYKNNGQAEEEKTEHLDQIDMQFHLTERLENAGPTSDSSLSALNIFISLGSLLSRP